MFLDKKLIVLIVAIPTVLATIALVTTGYMIAQNNNDKDCENIIAAAKEHYPTTTNQTIEKLYPFFERTHQENYIDFENVRDRYEEEWQWDRSIKRDTSLTPLQRWERDKATSEALLLTLKPYYDEYVAKCTNV